MSDSSAPLADVVRALGPPLDYLAADDFRRAATTKLPLAVVRQRIADARATSGGQARAVLDELTAILTALEDPANDPAPWLRQAHALLPRLRDVTVETADEPEDPTPVLTALAAPVETLDGVGPKRAQELERFGLSTVEDVLFHMPFRYEDHRRVLGVAELRVGENATTAGEITHVRQGMTGRRGRQFLEAVIADGGGQLVCVWFHQLQWFANRLARGRRLLVHGRVEMPALLGPPRMIHPDVVMLEPGEDPARHAGIVPIYEKPTAMPVGVMRRIVAAAVGVVADRMPQAVPAAIAARQRLVDPARALRYLHEPPTEADIEALDRARSFAHRSLVFEELFFLQLGLALRRRVEASVVGTAFAPSVRLVPALRAALPFTPTRAQGRAVEEIVADLRRPHPMRRLLQGDVGSGKTLVALLAALEVIEAGLQVALMAPTEVLAEQHFATVEPLVRGLGLRTVLLTGSTKAKARREALAGLADGSIVLAIGTHALIQEGVTFADLGFAIVDEQHRFGVLQRAALDRQQRGPIDVLVMSATPIPRTLALTLYGDLAVSTLDELPPGRTPIATRLCREARRGQAYDLVRAQVAAGHQAYIVYPLVEESEKSPLRAATTMVRELEAGALSGLRLGLVHGRMKPEEKDRVMRAFKGGEFDVLVSTTVIEVGIDVPNATVMVVEHAERFGLAQLHQLRGRVGRGQAAGHCVLMVPDWMPDETYQRVSLLERSTDGFQIAEADLVFRGPGDFLGTRQAGLPPFRVANLLRDTDVLRAARDEALAWLEQDPTLERPASRVVRAVLEHRWQGRLGLARVG